MEYSQANIDYVLKVVQEKIDWLRDSSEHEGENPEEDVVLGMEIAFGDAPQHEGIFSLAKNGPGWGLSFYESTNMPAPILRLTPVFAPRPALILRLKLAFDRRPALALAALPYKVPPRFPQSSPTIPK